MVFYIILKNEILKLSKDHILFKSLKNYVHSDMNKDVDILAIRHFAHEKYTRLLQQDAAEFTNDLLLNVD